VDRKQLFQGLNDAGTYSGRCEVTFEKPFGHLCGQATVTVESRPEVNLEVSTFEIDPTYGNSPLALQAFLLGEPLRAEGTGVKLTVHAHTEDRRPSSISVETDAGTFSATSALLNPPMFLSLRQDKALSFIPNDLTFASLTKETAKYWLMPLQGPFAKHFLRRQGPPHPMGLDNAGYYPITADGRACGFQMFEAGHNPRHPLATYDAIAFGELRSSVNTVDAVWEELPVGLQAALNFAIGADVLAPWIETRTEAGHIVRRFFIRLGEHVTEEGFPAFTKVNEFQPDSGIGAFLRDFFALPTARRRSLVAPLNLMRSGSPGAFTIEDSITDLVKALDNLCSAHGFITQDLLSRLSATNRAAAKTIIDNARDALSRLRSQNAPTSDEVDALNLICGRLSNAATTARDFGLAVKDLLRKFGLHDGEVMDHHFTTLGKDRDTWAGLLSKVRGEVIHKGHLYISDREQLRNWFAFSRHLHDLCTRIILAEVNYRGTYQASTHTWQGEYHVDRVKPGMPVKDLGFVVVPTTI